MDDGNDPVKLFSFNEKYSTFDQAPNVSEREPVK